MKKFIALTLATLSVSATAFADMQRCSSTTPRGTLCEATNGKQLRSCGTNTFILPTSPISSCDGNAPKYDATGKPFPTGLPPKKS